LVKKVKDIFAKGPAIILMVGLFSLFSCGENLRRAEQINLAEIPIQTVRDMFVVDTKNGLLTMRMEAKLMERYETDTLSYELFPEGFCVYSYDEKGRLETTIKADRAKHSKASKGSDEVWVATGNVVVTNIFNQEVMESDTLYWNREKEIIWTDCYVKMYSPDGFMQGYGMESDQRARNTVIKKPFNSYAFVEESEKQVDSVNFVGPVVPRK
jgi:LPS export ABC transporter protein LptC